MPFGALLRRYRYQAGLSQDELGERAGLTGQAIGTLERGKRRYPYPGTVRRLADALGLADPERAQLLAAVPSRRRGVGVSREAPLDSRTSTPMEDQGAAALFDLPMPLNQLLGRAEEVARLGDLLMSGARLLTLTGPGGVGKSRLALQLAREAQSRFPGGVVYLPLASLTDSRLVIPTLARVLGVRESSEAVVQRLGRALPANRLLVVLDNCEHVLPAPAEVSALLEVRPQLVILATSRTPLRVRGEQEYRVAPLQVPAVDRATTVEETAAWPAVRLFVERARIVDRGFELNPANVAAVADICRRLDGLPLAIELAAPRVKLLSPGALLERLHAVLPRLSAGPDAPARQRTLRATFAWSYDLLGEEERALLRRLSVFSGGCTLEGAQAIGGTSEAGAIDVLNGLTSLVNNSLLRLEEVAGQRRFVMLETIRDYARDELQRHGEEAAAREAHAGFMLDLAREIEPLLSGTGQVQWTTLLLAEEDNVRSALRRQLAEGHFEAVGRMLAHLLRFWWITGQMVEARRWAEEVLAGGSGVPPWVRAHACFVAGTAAAEHGDEAAAGLIAEARALARAEADRRLEGQSLYMEGFLAPLRGDAAAGIELMRQALEILRETGDAWNIGFCLSGLSALSALLGRLDDAEWFGAEYLAVAESMGDLLGVARAKDYLALVALLRDDLDGAAPMLRDAIALAQDVDQPQLIARCLMGLAVVAGRTDPVRAARNFGAADAIRERAGVAIWHMRRPLYDQVLQTVQAALGPESFNVAWIEGRAMTREQAVASAMEG